MLGSSPDGLKQGDRLDVVYLPKDPGGAEVEVSPRLRTGTWVLTILGGVCLFPLLGIEIAPGLTGRDRPRRPRRNRQSGANGGATTASMRRPLAMA